MFDSEAGQRGCQLGFKPMNITHKRFKLIFKMTPNPSSFFFFALVIFLSLLEEVGRHVSNSLYDLLLPLVFPRKELLILKVIEHDGNKSHLIIWLEQK